MSSRPKGTAPLRQMAARQLLAGDPPETWRTVRRLAGLAYDWHNIMHMIAGVVSYDISGQTVPSTVLAE